MDARRLITRYRAFSLFSDYWIIWLRLSKTFLQAMEAFRSEVESYQNGRADVKTILEHLGPG